MSGTGMNEILWWVRVTDWEDQLVYEGPAPAPAELVTLTVEDMNAGRLYKFDMKPMGVNPRLPEETK